MYHFLKPQTCNICGLKWGSTFNEGYIQLGRPVIECAGCWEPIHTGRKEWKQLRAGQKWTYLAQSFGYLLPVVLLAGLALLGLLAESGDVEEALVWSLWGLLAAFGLIVLRAFVQIAASLSRTSGRNTATAQPVRRRRGSQQ